MTRRTFRLFARVASFLPAAAVIVWAGGRGVSAGQEGGAATNVKPPDHRRNFVTCPIVRDTATLPCWLAEYNGELYYLGTQGSSGTAFYPPQLNHEVLVEGTVSTGPRICGGIPLNSLRISVMIELNRACNTVLPAEAAFTAPPSPLAPPPRYPDTTREFNVAYDFDNDYLTLHTTRVVAEAARVAKAINASRVQVNGWYGVTLLSDGRVLSERPEVPKRRATTMGEHLAGLGVPADRIHVTWQRQPDRPDGVTDPARRRVTITLIP
jgi:hypothetical protein